MITVTNLGDGTWLFILVWLAWMAKASPRQRWAGALGLVLLLVGDAITHYLLKGFIHRPRPCWVIPEARVLADTTRLSMNSFPSNHSFNSAAVATFVALLMKNRTMTIGLATVVLMVGFSRVYVGVHYPSDVLAGFLLGSAWGWTGVVVVRRLSSHPWVSKRWGSFSRPS
jgi:undecaprenyl-diphosphatase